MALVTYDQLRPRFGIKDSRQTIRRKIKQKKFPPPVRTSEARIAWHDYEIQAHVDGLEHGNAVNFRAKAESSRSRADNHSKNNKVGA